MRYLEPFVFLHLRNFWMSSILEQEIYEQPDVIAHLIAVQSETARQIAAAIRDFNPAFVWIAARGTSDNAARYAQYLFAVHARLAVGLATPSVHTLYEAAPDMSRALVIGVSQSGQSQDVRQVITDARAQGALTVTITNDSESPLAQGAAFHLALNAGAEKSVAATKSYTTELTAFALIAAALTDKTELWDGLSKLPAWARTTLDAAQETELWAQRYRYMERYAVIGRGYNYCTAFEISLKVKELSYIAGEGYSEADFRHGPIAMINSGFPVIVVAPSGATLEQQRDLLVKLNEKGAECLAISDNSSLAALTHHLMPLPVGMPEWISPITAVMPGQVFAMSLAKLRGNPVDQPRGLTKVTNTV